MNRLLTFVVSLILVPALSSAALKPDASVDDTLKALDDVGRNLKSFSANVTLRDEDKISQDTSSRTGLAVYELKPDGNSRFRVTFLKRIQDGLSQDQRIEYLLDGNILIDRNYPRKSETKHHLGRPGEKINLLKLGEGPFPLPIGQKREDVLKQFDVKHVELATNEMPDAMHLMLTPKPGTQFDRKFTSIDVWVDFKTSMPRRIETIDKNGTMSRGTDLENIKLNVDIPDADFKLPEVTGGDWQRRDEPFND